MRIVRLGSTYKIAEIAWSQARFIATDRYDSTVYKRIMK